METDFEKEQREERLRKRFESKNSLEMVMARNGFHFIMACVNCNIKANLVVLDIQKGKELLVVCPSCKKKVSLLKFHSECTMEIVL